MDEFDSVETETDPEFQAEETEAEEGFPSVRYGPDGQSAIFHSEKNVPPGWFDHPSKVKGAADPSKVEAAPRRPDKAVIMKELKRRNITFNPMTAASALYAMLEEKPAESKSAPKPKS